MHIKISQIKWNLPVGDAGEVVDGPGQLVICLQQLQLRDHRREALLRDLNKENIA